MNFKLLYIITSIEYGGAELQTIAQVNYLHQQGYTTHLLVLHKIKAKALRKELELPQSKIIELNFPHTYVSTFAVLKSTRLIYPILNIIQQEQISHVVAHLPFSHFIMRMVYLAQRLTFRPHFALFPYHHSMQYQANPLNTLGKRLFNGLNATLARFTDTKNICVSDAVKENLQAHTFVHNPQIIFNSIPYQQIDNQLAQQYLAEHKLPFNAFTLLFPGRLHPSKGHLFFINAFGKMVQKMNWKVGEIQVIIAGGGTIEQDLKNAITEAKLQDFFHITGFIPNPLLLSFYKIAKLTIVPSINEGFGIVAIEALMQGCPVLCSDAGGLKEVIQDGKNGWQFPKLDEQALIEKMEFIYQNRHHELLPSSTLIANYQKRFTLNTQIQKLLQVLLD